MADAVVEIAPVHFVWRWTREESLYVARCPEICDASNGKVGSHAYSRTRDGLRDDVEFACGDFAMFTGRQVAHVTFELIEEGR